MMNLIPLIFPIPLVFFLLKNFPCNGFCLKGEKTKLNKKTKHKENCKIFSQNKVCRHAHFHSYIVVV